MTESITVSWIFTRIQEWRQWNTISVWRIPWKSVKTHRKIQSTCMFLTHDGSHVWPFSGQLCTILMVSCSVQHITSDVTISIYTFSFISSMWTRFHVSTHIHLFGRPCQIHVHISFACESFPSHHHHQHQLLRKNTWEWKCNHYLLLLCFTCNHFHLLYDLITPHTHKQSYQCSSFVSEQGVKSPDRKLLPAGSWSAHPLWGDMFCSDSPPTQVSRRYTPEIQWRDTSGQRNRVADSQNMRHTWTLLRWSSLWSQTSLFHLDAFSCWGHFGSDR